MEMSRIVDIDKKLANVCISNLNDSILNRDYKTVSYILIQTSSEKLKGCVKEILISFKTDDEVAYLINGVVDILKNDINCWNPPDHVKTIFNDIDDTYMSIHSTAKVDKIAHQKYNAILERVFTDFFKDAIHQIDKFKNDNQDMHLFQFFTALIHFTQLIDVKNFDSIMFSMTKLAEHMFINYNQIAKLQMPIIEFVLQINHRLVNYLAVIPGNPISKGLKESIFIYNTIRTNIITMTYNHPEIITKALSILEQRSRFFGLTADAIPENENHGDYIVVDPLNTAFEDDDVYDDYERFLANLPN